MRVVGWPMREEMRWDRHCDEARAEKRERCRAVRGSDVAAIVVVVDQENDQVVVSLFLGRRCFISMIDLEMRRVHGPHHRAAAADIAQRP